MAHFTRISAYWFFSLLVAFMSLGKFGLMAQTSFEEVWDFLVNYVDLGRVALYAHMVFAPLALALAPFQFWSTLRSRRPLVHRSLGYAYVAAIAVGGLSVFPMIPYFAGSAWAATGFLVLAVLWLASTGLAISFARNGDVISHRKWMTRSAALTFAAVALRLEMLPLMAAGMSIHQTYDVTAWLSWLLPLLFVEWKMRRRVNRTAPVE